MAQFVVAMGIERVVDGEIESSPWIWAPPGQQPEWQTDGLLEAAIDLRHTIDADQD